MKFYLLYKYIEKEGFPYIKYEKLISTRHNILPENFPEYKIAIVDIDCNSFLVNLYGDESAEYGIDTLCLIAEQAGIKGNYTPENLFEKLIWPNYPQYHTGVKNSSMTLDEAIKHCEEKANGCDACAEEHKQLAEWLKELKGYRAVVELLKNTVDKWNLSQK